MANNLDAMSQSGIPYLTHYQGISGYWVTQASLQRTALGRVSCGQKGILLISDPLLLEGVPASCGTHTEQATEIKRIAAKICQIPAGEHPVYLYSAQMTQEQRPSATNLFFEIHVGKQKTGNLEKVCLGISHSDSLWHCILNWETFRQQFYAPSSKTKLVVSAAQAKWAEEIQTYFSLDMVFVEDVPDWDTPHYISKLPVSRKTFNLIRDYLKKKVSPMSEMDILLSTGQVWGKYFDQPQKVPGVIRWRKEHTMLIDIAHATPQRIWASSCLPANQLIVWGFYSAQGLQKLRLIPADSGLLEIDSSLFIPEKYLY